MTKSRKLALEEDGEKISLGARKTTNIIRLYPNNLNKSLDINPFHQRDKGKQVSGKGAFHSAAFLLQRCLADQLDVSPEEIELAAITEHELDDGTERSTGKIILSDELPNGSGFVEYLYNHLEKFFSMCLSPTPENRFAYSFLNEEHAKDCKSSCYKDLQGTFPKGVTFSYCIKYGIGLIMCTPLAEVLRESELPSTTLVISVVPTTNMKPLEPSWLS